MKVHSRLKPGLDESFYEKALVIELVGMGLRTDNQREYPVRYEGHFPGTLVPDLVVEDAVIADPKVVTEFNETHIAQMLGYLNITGLEVALLLNFKPAVWRKRRVLPHHRPPIARVDAACRHRHRVTEARHRFPARAADAFSAGGVRGVGRGAGPRAELRRRAAQRWRPARSRGETAGCGGVSYFRTLGLRTGGGISARSLVATTFASDC